MSQRRIVGKRTVKAFWNCPYCDRTHIDGLIDYCPGCGRHKIDSTHYNLNINNIIEVSKEGLKKAGIIHSETGEKRPDWKCDYCNSLNNWADTNCSSCGSLKSDSKSDYFGTKSVSDDKRYTRDKSVKHELCICESSPAIGSIKKPKLYTEMHYNDNRLRMNFKYAAIVFGIISLLVLLVYLFKPYDVQTEVDGFSWYRNINIEELNTYQYSDWSLPSNARLLYTNQEYRDEVEEYEVQEEVTKTRREIVDYDIDYELEYEDNGDGTYTEYTVEVKTPIYEDVEYTEIETVTKTRPIKVLRTKYYYEIDKWEHDYSSKASGNDKNPYWNENFTLNSDERIGSKTENYTINYTNGDTKDCNYNEWMQTDLGDRVIITKCKLGIVYKQTRE